MLRTLTICLLLWVPLAGTCLAEDPVFSGPQVGERLPSFQALGLFGDESGKSFDLVAKADGGPILIVFFHELTRPGFGLMRAITNFASRRTEQGLTVGVVFLTDDVTKTTQWASNVRRMFSDKVIYGVSPDGVEGPGAYGLNRNVTLTILVGDDGNVTGNFALVQPQLQADGPAILKAIADVTGGGEIPAVEDLDPAYANRMAMQRQTDGDQRGNRSDAQLGGLLRAVINRQASESQVREAASKVEAYVAENEAARRELARIVTTVVNSGKIENYGTEVAQSILRQWLDKYASRDQPSAEARPESRERGPAKESNPGDDQVER